MRAQRDTCDEAPGAHSRSELLRGAAAGALVQPLAPLPASAKGYDAALESLTTYGVPENISKENVPFGWSVAVEPFGIAKSAYDGRIRLGEDPLVSCFYVPPLWVVAKPVVDNNGTSGTISGNDFGKGDATTLWVDVEYSGPDLEDMKKADYLTEIKKALTLKGSGLIDSLRVVKVQDGTSPGYKLITYDYTINSGAGFELDRTGIASVCQKGASKNLQIFWTGVTSNRWDKSEEMLSLMARSWRVAEIPPSVAKYIVTKILDLNVTNTI